LSYFFAKLINSTKFAVEPINNSIDEMVENMFKAINDGNYVEKIIDSQNRLSYVYKVQTTQGLKEFKFATGSNGFIVSFIPNWL